MNSKRNSFFYESELEEEGKWYFVEDFWRKRPGRQILLFDVTEVESTHSYQCFFPTLLPIFTCLYLPGETSSGKSTLLNLILGEQLLPYSVLSTTSTICELRYGDTPKLVAHFKDKGSGDTSKTVLLNKPSEACEQSYLQQISEFVHLKTNREKGSDYEKIELFWPHNLLKVRHEQAQ